jgi:1-aminocyclopropane-1-carboxylate deaminase/D-cysteine desulfhydrase-like pyridoxal-dependent ACC family enzyme
MGLDLWIKRDDLTGFAMGGNKGRKLEYLMAAALASGADTVISCGSAQSNFVRQLGAACACLGLHCGAAVMKLPYSAHSGKPAGGATFPENGNVVLDRLVGIDLRMHPDGTWEELDARVDELEAEYAAAGRMVYRIPIGGSRWLGAYAFEQAGYEIPPGFDWIVFASSSGSTQTGLARAFHGTSTQVLGIACDPEPDMVEDFAELAEAVRVEVGGPALNSTDFLFNLGFVGPGYGVPSEDGNAAIQYLAQAEGIFLDPIYSGKAFAGLIALATSGAVSGKVLFWHTGGTPALFAYPPTAAR